MDNFVKKSVRKSKKQYATELSAGIIAKAKDSCPADITDRVKKALLKEIAEFNEDKQNDAKREAELSARGGPALEAYQEWLMLHGGHETPEANPDIVSDEDSLKYNSSEKDPEILGLLNEFRESLTKLEVKVWNLVMHYQYSHSKTADLLIISRIHVEMTLKRAMKKFTLFTEAIKRVEEERRNRP